MKEADFAGKLKDSVDKIFIKNNLSEKYSCQRNANLFYRIPLDNNLNPMVKIDKKPKRGHSAFQTDLCIFLKKDIGKDEPKG